MCHLTPTERHAHAGEAVEHVLRVGHEDVGGLARDSPAAQLVALVDDVTQLVARDVQVAAVEGLFRVRQLLEQRTAE